MYEIGYLLNTDDINLPLWSFNYSILLSWMYNAAVKYLFFL